MPDLKALATVLERETELRDEASRTLREAEQRLAQLLAHGETLRQYRQETATRWAAPSGQLTSPQQLHTAREFLQRLDEALSQQTTAEQRARHAADQRRAELMAAEQRVAVVEKLIDRRREGHARVQLRREQKVTDETAQLLHARRDTSREHDTETWQGA